ncbi:biotin transporter BioY [Salinicoccus sp. HZC-1]|uniref:biotin transporter BioY n=1 Tax=Salinicoccus sp. HZC-1 TaxID=3385497 RepID=UPI00398B2BB3
MKTKHLIYAALFAAVIAVGAQIRIPIGPVPITFQVPMVLLAGFLLGPRLGALSTLVYMIVGLVGVPVFAGSGGIGSLVSPSFGFIIGYIPAAFIAGFGSGENKSLIQSAVFGIIALIVIYISGFLYFIFIMNQVIGTPVGIVEALMVTVLPFAVKDTIIAVLTAMFAKTLYARGLRPAI